MPPPKKRAFAKPMIIAKRTLYYTATDPETEVPIEVSAPVWTEGAWWCAYTIGWPTGVRSHAGGGVDAVQSLVLTLRMIGAELHASRFHEAGHLRFERAGGGYGFPVPGNARHLLVGDDARYG